MNVFEAVKQSATTRQAAEHYGIHVNRNGMACCPFHNDKTPSMKLDRRYHCFGCGADGDNRQEYGSSGSLLPETVPPGISAGAWAFLLFPAVSGPHRKARSPVPAVRRLLSFPAHTGRRQNQSHPHPHRSRSSGNADPASCLGFYRDGTGSKPSRSALHGFHNAPQLVLL